MFRLDLDLMAIIVVHYSAIKEKGYCSISERIYGTDLFYAAHQYRR